MMPSAFKIFMSVLVWEFTCVLMLMMANTVVNGYVAPIMKNAANSTTLMNGTLYNQQIYPVEAGFNIALYIFMALPLIYLIVRMLLKKEQTSPQTVYSGGGF